MSFLKNVSVLLAGNTIAQVIPFLFSPIISRLYTPEDFGFMGLVYGTIAMTLSPILNLRYEQAVILPKDDRKSISLINVSFISSLGLTVLFIIVSIIFNEQVVSFFNETRLQTWIFIVPLFMIFVGLQTPLNYWLIRKQAFKATAFNKIAQTSIITIAAISLSVFKFDGNLIIAYLSGWLIYVLFTFYQSVKKDFQFILIKSSELLTVIKEYKSFPIYNILPTILITVCQIFIPVLYLQKYYDTETVGYFTHIRQYTLIPLSLLSIAISQVLLESISSKIKEKQRIFPLLKKLLTSLIIISIPAYFVVYFFGPDLFSIIFGEQWRISGEFAQTLILGFVIQTIVAPFGQIITAVNKMKYSIIFPVVYFVLLLSLFFISLSNIESVLWYITLSEAIAYIVFLIISLSLAHHYEKSIN